MDFCSDDRTCSFCGAPGAPGRPLAAGLGAMICRECVEVHHAALTDPDPGAAAAQHGPWESMSDAELLRTLPLILRSAEQAVAFAHEWVDLVRARGMSWAAIGGALGVSRQAAWERFAKRPARGPA